MNWQQLHLHCEKPQVELAETLLLEAGALSITFEDAGDQPLFEPMPNQSPLWDSVIVTGLFADAETSSMTDLAEHDNGSNKPNLQANAHQTNVHQTNVHQDSIHPVNAPIDTSLISKPTLTVSRKTNKESSLGTISEFDHETLLFGNDTRAQIYAQDNTSDKHAALPEGDVSADTDSFASPIALSRQHLEALAQDIASQTHASRVWLTPLADTDWERVWMSHYHPIECANDLWIVPKWLDAPKPDAINIMMDPGLAFGTGYHATTRLCLDWLTEQDLKDKTIIDYGCGSGILGIGALLLGAKQVYAVDIDPQAVLATKQNAKRNHIAQQLHAFLPNEFAQKYAAGDIKKADVMVANILAKPLMTLAPYLATLCAPNAQIVLSGLILEQLEEVRLAYQPWFELTDTYSFATQDDAHWHRLSGRFTH